MPITKYWLTSTCSSCSLLWTFGRSYKIAFIDDEVCRLEESVLVGEDFD